MDGWQKAQVIATIVQTLVVVISLYFIWRQVTQQTDLARIANVQSLVGLSSPYNLELIKDQNMARFWVEGAEKFETYDKVDKFRYEQLLIWWLILHENIFYQKQKNLLEDAIYATWSHDLELFIAQHRLEYHWPTLPVAFQSEFRKHVDEMIREVKLKSDSASHKKSE